MVGSKFVCGVVSEAVRAEAVPIELLVENGDVYKNCAVDYHDGERYADLERDNTKPDVLSEIIKPRTK